MISRTCHATNAANYWFVGHDVLSHIKFADTILWMEIQVGPRGGLYYYRWLFLEHGFNAGTDFEGIPVGNHT